jgi:NhaP-type Na+/H+ or K+/H+ antiporter
MQCLSLVLIRPLAVAISLIGTKVRPITAIFIGWFGPRGIASILYIFIVIETEGIVGHQLIYGIVMVTVLLSIFAHGVTAAPTAKFYGRKMADEDIVQPDALEKTPVPEMPLRAHPKI